ncbi:hypothetical protein BGX27_008275, partial [Mortierella sp. AM989]
MQCCPFSLHQLSTSSEDPSGLSSRATEYAAPLSPPQSSPIQTSTASVHYHYQNQGYHLETQNSNEFANDEGFRTQSMYSSEGELDNIENPIQSASDRMEENADHDTFLERLGELDMEDMTISPVSTPLTTHTPSYIPFRSRKAPMTPVTPTRSRRMIVEEESDQSVTDEATKDILNHFGTDADVRTEQSFLKEVGRQGESSPREDGRSNTPNINTKPRILRDITKSMASRETESRSYPIDLGTDSTVPELSHKQQDAPMDDIAPMDQNRQQGQHEQQQPGSKVQQQMEGQYQRSQGLQNTLLINSTNATQHLRR